MRHGETDMDVRFTVHEAAIAGRLVRVSYPI